MKKEITKMYGYAIGKIVFAVVMATLAYFVIFQSDTDVETFGKVVCSLCWGCGCMVYLVFGVRTVLNGMDQVKCYIGNSVYSEARLNEECENATDYGRIRVGEKHVFANASNGFFVIPYEAIEAAYTRTRKYTYAYIQAKGLPKRIKMYYLFSGKPREAINDILWKMEQVSHTNP